MRYPVLIEADTEVEAIRLDMIDELMKHTGMLKRMAEQVLGVKIKSVRPVGKILQTGQFDEGQDIEVGFYANSTKIVDKGMSELLQSHLSSIQLEGVGTICPLVFNN